MNEEAKRAAARLGEWAAALDTADVPRPVLDRLSLVLLDALGVTALGAALDEQAALRSAWNAPDGPAPLIGAGRSVTVDAAAWLNAMALVSLELDEGNKYAKGHPAAHGFPAVLALASELDATGPDTAAALLAAYEVASRFGRATSLRPGAHPHGSWGVAGAAAGCARLLRLGPEATAAAIDAGAGLPVAGHFSSATDGNPVRDAWMGASNLSGLVAARMAAAGLARNTGTAGGSLGDLLGGFDAAELTDGLGERWDVTRGYFKRHASCSFTHPAADAVLPLRAGLDPSRISRILVETHALGAGLGSPEWDNRLSAMFSTPFVVATALLDGEVGPRASDGARLGDPALRDLARRVRLVAAGDLTARLPAERAARVTIELDDGTSLTREQPNPVGDADHEPLTEPDVIRMLKAWLPGRAALVDRAAEVARDLPALARVGGALRGLADDTAEKEPS